MLKIQIKNAKSRKNLSEIRRLVLKGGVCIMCRVRVRKRARERERETRKKIIEKEIDR